MSPILSSEIRWLLRQATRLKSLYVAEMSAVLLGSLAGLVEPLILKWIIDDVIPWRQEDMLLLAALAFFVVFLFHFGFNSLSFVIDTYASERLTFGIRLKLLRHLQKLSAEYFDRTSPGELLHRLEQDVDQIRELGGSKVAALVRIAVMTSSTVVIMLLLSWQLTLLILPLVPAMLLLRRLSFKRLRSASDRAQAASARRLGFLQDHLPAITQVQLLNRVAGERRRFARLARRVLDALVDRRITELFLQFSTEICLIVATATVLGYGGYQVLRDTLTVGGLVAFYTYLTRIFGPTQTLVALYSSLHRASASVRRVQEVLDARPAVVEPDHPRYLRDIGPLDVTCEAVRFAYSDEREVLRCLDLDIAAGEKVALVGTSGCGKSTLARLLTRMYDPDSGKIQLAGVDLRHLRLRDLHARVALVPQEPILFDVSLYENLRYADPGAEDERLWETLRMAQLEPTVQAMPQGWSTPVGVRGSRLSGGQRQRVAVARAILQDPRLLILDEATSALDGPTEHALLEALDEAVCGRTTLLIAHRLSAIRWADRILLLDDGQLVDTGSHRELYRRSHLYREICDKQLTHEPTPARILPHYGAVGEQRALGGALP